MKRYIVGLQVEDQPGVLARVAGLFSRRGYNIDTITVGKTIKQGISTMVISLTGDEKVVEQVKKQLNKLIDVIKVSEFPAEESVIRELCLVKVAVPNKEAKTEIMNYAKVYKTKIIDITPKSMALEVIGTPEKIDSFLELIKSFGIKEISRTGVTAVSRG